MAIDRSALVRSTAAGTILQLSMVLIGHSVAAVATLFAPLGMLISLVAGLLYGRWSGQTRPFAGGALAGGICAFLGIAFSLGLGDVTGVILVFGTLSSAVTGLVGGWLGARFASTGAPQRTAQPPSA